MNREQETSGGRPRGRAGAGGKPSDTRELRIEQEQRKHEESGAAADAALPDEADQHRRRAAKAAYLESKLAERERAEGEENSG